jgi:hypothetical protein
LAIGINRWDIGHGDPMFSLPRLHIDSSSKKAQEQHKNEREFEMLECGRGEKELGFTHQETVDKDICAHTKSGAT